MKDNEIFMGVRADLPNLMQAMDVFVFPSLYEDLGIVTIEAQAAGLPCFVSDQIPLEAHITDLIKSVPLEFSAEEWAEQILKGDQKMERLDISREIVSAGYGIKQNVKQITDFILRKRG